MPGRRHAGPVPRFFLYGEPPRAVADGFMHVETIAARSALYDWKIGPHAHGDLHQLLLVARGRGMMRIEGGRETFEAPALLAVPATLVHAFQFEPDTRGHVVTLAEGSLRELARREPGFREIFAAARCLELEAGEAAELEHAAAVLLKELRGSRPARLVAAEAQLATVLVAALRALARGAVSLRAKRGPRATLVARFRDTLDVQFRAGWSLTRYARALAVSPGRLRAACLEVTGRPPMRLVHERLLLEAKRSLAYTSQSVSAIAYELGFCDPGYFSRFFRARTGESPARFRRRSG